MLIVVIIVGILSAAILPRLTGYMARIRDLKRQVDLRNIAAAIQSYVGDKGEFPLLGRDGKLYSDLNQRYAGNASDLVGINQYISSSPKDPSNARVGNIITTIRHRKNFAKPWLKQGEYLYISRRKNYFEKLPNSALLFAKVETPDYANYISIGEGRVLALKTDPLGSSFWCTNHSKRNNRVPLPSFIEPDILYFCTSVKKADTPSMKKKDDGTVECTYSDPEQLYYIVTVEG